MSSGRGLGRNNRDPCADRGQRTQDVALDPVVHHDDVIFFGRGLRKPRGPTPGALAPFERLQAGSVLGEILAHQAGPGAGSRNQRLDVETAVRVMSDDAMRHAAFADTARQGTGVNAADRDDASAFQPVVQVAVRPPVRRPGGRVAKDRTLSGGFGRSRDLLDVFGVGSDVADMGEGEDDDLGHIRGVGEDLLVTAHRGVEANLAHRFTNSAATEAGKNLFRRQAPERRCMPGGRRLGIGDSSGSRANGGVGSDPGRDGQCEASPAWPRGAQEVPARAAGQGLRTRPPAGAILFHAHRRPLPR